MAEDKKVQECSDDKLEDVSGGTNNIYTTVRDESGKESWMFLGAKWGNGELVWGSGYRCEEDAIKAGRKAGLVDDEDSDWIFL